MRHDTKKQPRWSEDQRGADETGHHIPQGRNLGSDEVDDAVGNHSTALLIAVTIHKGVLEFGVTRITIEFFKGIELDFRITLDDEVLIIGRIRHCREVLLTILTAGSFESLIF